MKYFNKNNYKVIKRKLKNSNNKIEEIYKIEKINEKIYVSA